MKRFLILFILTVFVTVSCARPNKVGWTRPDFRLDQFEKDRKECIDSIDKNLNSEAFGKALGECLEKEGYKYEASQDKKPPSEDQEPLSVGEIVLLIVLSPVLIFLWATLP